MVKYHYLIHCRGFQNFRISLSPLLSRNWFHNNISYYQPWIQSTEFTESISAVGNAFISIYLNHLWEKVFSRHFCATYPTSYWGVPAFTVNLPYHTHSMSLSILFSSLAKVVPTFLLQFVCPPLPSFQDPP